jgi:hypothetical protein
VLVLLDINENGLYDLHQNFLMAKRKEPVTLVPLIVSIRERDELDAVFCDLPTGHRLSRGGPQTCAAHGRHAGRSHPQQHLWIP